MSDFDAKFEVPGSTAIHNFYRCCEFDLTQQVICGFRNEAAHLVRLGSANAWNASLRRSSKRTIWSRSVGSEPDRST